MNHVLEVGLLLAAVGQACVAIINLNLVRLLHWEATLAAMPLLVRQVFRVHVWFISITLAIFAVMTWRFAPAMTTGVDPAARWLACSIGLFWGIRAILQVAYYSGSHWRGITSRTAVHIILLAVYSGWAVLYLVAGIKH